MGVPDFTLGWGVIKWITDNLVQPNGPKAGEPFRCTEFQVRFILWFYAVGQDGNFIHNEGVRRLAKGSGKSPFAAVLALAEMLGPVRFDRFDDRVLGGCVGRRMGLSWVQVAAVSEEQTKNTMRMVRAIVNHKRCRLKAHYQLEVGKTYVEASDGSKLEQITSSAATAEGNEISFAVADETEHWLEAGGGVALYETLAQNLSKSSNARLLQTSNAWEPGAGSVAEKTYEGWCEQENGLLSDAAVGEGKLMLYDAIIAPYNTALGACGVGEVPLGEALGFVYQDCPWAALDNITARILTPSYPVARSWRFYLNRPQTSDDAWCPAPVFSECADKSRVVEAGEPVVMFFDGSKSDDFTALVGCSMVDGFVFTIGVWEPTGGVGPHGRRGGLVDVDAVDAGVRAAFERYDVVAFWGDVKEWESYVRDSWAKDFGDRLILWAQPGGVFPAPIAWDMRNRTIAFTEATEQCLDEIANKRFAHDGDPRLVWAVANCRVKETRGRWGVRKESPKSSKKIDAAVCMIGARMLYHAVSASGEWANRNKQTEWSLGW